MYYIFESFINGSSEEDIDNSVSSSDYWSHSIEWEWYALSVTIVTDNREDVYIHLERTCEMRSSMGLILQKIDLVHQLLLKTGE